MTEAETDFNLKVNLRYANSLRNDPDLRITLTLTSYLFATVNIKINFSEFENIHYQPTLQTPADSPWSYGSNVMVAGYPTYNGLDVIQASAALVDFCSFMKKIKLNREYDVAVAFVK